MLFIVPYNYKEYHICNIIMHAVYIQVACIVVTVLLHYFFLAAFCWMLCEGIIIYVLLAQVFYDGFFKRLRFYSMIGWGMHTYAVL